jgi:hypothetical protein
MKEHILFEFVTIFFIVLIVFYNNHVTKLSHSILGKLIAVLLIIFYTIYDTTCGVLICGLVILYYQCSFFEGMYGEIKETFENNEALSNNLRSQFESQYCKNGKLQYKNSDIKTEMTSHVFPEIEFKNNTCNPCNADCDYSIIEEKRIEQLQNEKNLTTPKDSNASFGGFTMK